MLVTTRTPRPPRGQSAVTNNNTEDQGQDQDEEEEEEEGDWTTDASVADAYLEFERRLLCLAVPLVEEAQTRKEGRRRTRSENDDDEVDA